ncbi:MAG TPA: hypothetical protein VGK19_02705 [Capsulimonadaceae bacterium]|jgi:hypothetical protein
MRHFGRVRLPFALSLAFSLLVGIAFTGSARAQTFDVTVDLAGTTASLTGTFDLSIQSTGLSGTTTTVTNITGPTNSTYLGIFGQSNANVAGNGDVTLTHPGGSPSSISQVWFFYDGSPNVYTFSVSAGAGNGLTSTLFDLGSLDPPYGSLTYVFGSAPVATGAYSISNYNSGSPAPAPELSTWVSFGLMLALFCVGLVVKRRRSDTAGVTSGGSLSV